MDYYFAAVIFLFGACVGSFLNVCVHRIPLEESVVHPRSRCPTCRRTIAWYDNVPLVSWLVLRARCRHCKASISPRYILIELLVASLFLGLWLLYGFSALTLVYWLVISGLVIATFIDFEHMIIPDRISLGGIAAGLIISPLLPSLHGAEGAVQALLRSAIGVAAGSGSLYAVAIIGGWIFKKDAMGLGDVKLLGAIGGFLGWQAVIFTIIVSSFLGSIVGITLILTGNRKWQSRIPFGPYLAIAATAWIFTGGYLWHLYLNWLLAPL